MSPLVRILLGLAVMVVGFLIVWKTGVIYEWFGTVDWAERKLGGGGSRLFYKLLGVGTVFIGIFIAVDLIGSILGGIYGLFMPNVK